jgi:hypothetical protein
MDIKKQNPKTANGDTQNTAVETKTETPALETRVIGGRDLRKAVCDKFNIPFEASGSIAVFKEPIDGNFRSEDNVKIYGLTATEKGIEMTEVDCSETRLAEVGLPAETKLVVEVTTFTENEDGEALKPEDFEYEVSVYKPLDCKAFLDEEEAEMDKEWDDLLN